MATAMNMAMGDVMMRMPWTLAVFRVMLVMWIVMMTAMMLPSAAPMILLFATINRRRSETGTPYATGLFALAYWALWAGIQHRGHGRTMGTGTCRAAVCDHGNRQHLPGRGRVP